MLEMLETLKKKFRTLKQNNEFCQEGNKTVTLKLASSFQNLKKQILEEVWRVIVKVSVNKKVGWVHTQFIQRFCSNHFILCKPASEPILAL